MKLARFGLVGNERPAVVLDDGTRVDVSSFGEDWNEAFFGSDGPSRLAQWLPARIKSLPRVPGGLRWASAVARPSKIVCIGLNYIDHARETGAEPPKEPVLFFKSTTAVAGPCDDLVYPRGGTKVDYEVELAVVIGKAARYVDADRALDHVAGFALHNDYSERSFQLERGGQWVKGKSCDTFAPIGPWMLTRDCCPEYRSLAMWLDVNGARRQTGTTANMIFDVPALVSYVSQFMTLLPGDVISTGTPPGVGLGMKPPTYLEVGDVVACGIVGLGEQRQRVTKEA